MSRLTHTVVAIDDILGRDNASLKKDHCTWMTREDGTRFTPAELRDELRKLRKAGFEVVTTTICNNFSKTGHCLGHQARDEEATND